MFFERKSQAAMEFLMTYGWAIMVVLLALGALAYFGVLNPQNILPEKCTFPTGFHCQDYLVNANSSEVALRFTNGKGEGMIILKIEVEDTEGNFDNCTLDFTTEGACGNVTEADEYCGDGSSGTGGYNDKVGWYLSSSQIGAATVPCDDITAYEGKAKANIHLTYYKATSDSTYNHTETGELLARAYTTS